MIANMAMKPEAARQLTFAAAARPERAMAGERVDDQTFFSSVGATVRALLKRDGQPAALLTAPDSPTGRRMPLEWISSANTVASTSLTRQSRVTSRAYR
jgi:hypothetical protein